MRICIRAAVPFNCLYAARVRSLRWGGEMGRKAGGNVG